MRVGKVAGFPLSPGHFPFSALPALHEWEGTVGLGAAVTLGTPQCDSEGL